MTIGAFIRERREEMGITQTELSFRCRIPQKNISLWELGRATPNIRNLERLSLELGFTLPWMEPAITGATRRYRRYVAARTSHQRNQAA